jgi:hypothetical protein
MLSALVLICSLVQTPDLDTCSRDTAVSVLRVPEDFPTPTGCLMHGQAYVAQTEIGQSLGTDERLKVVCDKRQIPGRSQAAARPMSR